MKKKGSTLNRKNFLKIAGTTGLGTLLSLFCGKEEEKDKTGESTSDKSTLNAQNKKSKFPQIPKRTLGKTGVKIATLGHGIMYNLVDNQIVLRKGLQWGINYWDTANFYAGGNSELGIGKFLKRNPKMRKDLFIVSKASNAWRPEDVEKRLQLSLKRMNTSYIDLYYGVHGLSDPFFLNDGLRKWAISAKKRKLIKYFGFSTHRNMADCLKRAAELDWIDAIMTSYNFRLMQDAEMQKAIDACHKAGIGLIAMKVMGLSISSEGDQKMTKRFLKGGYTEGQAKLKAVLNDKRIASACISMENTALITANASALVDKARLSNADMDYLKQYALDTCNNYCAGCSEICEKTVPDIPYISDTLRYLMYYNSYGETAKARRLFADIPKKARKRMATADFSLAEAQCPQMIPIGAFIKEAIMRLS